MIFNAIWLVTTCVDVSILHRSQWVRFCGCLPSSLGVGDEKTGKAWLVPALHVTSHGRHHSHGHISHGRPQRQWSGGNEELLSNVRSGECCYHDQCARASCPNCCTRNLAIVGSGGNVIAQLIPLRLTSSLILSLLNHQIAGSEDPSNERMGSADTSVSVPAQPPSPSLPEARSPTLMARARSLAECVNTCLVAILFSHLNPHFIFAAHFLPYFCAGVSMASTSQ